MALDMETEALLNLGDAEAGPWTAARAAALELSIPAEALPGVIDNIALLKSQTALFVAALGDRAGELPETFQP